MMSHIYKFMCKKSGHKVEFCYKPIGYSNSDSKGQGQNHPIRHRINNKLKEIRKNVLYDIFG